MFRFQKTGRNIHALLRSVEIILSSCRFYGPFIARMVKSALSILIRIWTLGSQCICTFVIYFCLFVWITFFLTFSSVFGGAPSDQAAINHGTYFYWASQEGLIKNGSSIVSHNDPTFFLFRFVLFVTKQQTHVFFFFFWTENSTEQFGQRSLTWAITRMTTTQDSIASKHAKLTRSAWTVLSGRFEIP